MSFPKDMTWTNVTFDVSPDGSVHTRIGSVSSHNDATVIGVVAGANAAMLHDGLNFAERVLDKAPKNAVIP